MPGTHPSRRLLLAHAIVLLGVAVALGGCTADSVSIVGPTAEPTYSVTGDGILKLGTLFDSTHSLAEAQVAGVELAVRDINDAGGVLGVPVEVRHRNSGKSDGSRIDEALTELTDAATDAIIGPASSSLAERVTPAVVAAGVPLISPSADSIALTTLDDDGFIARTVPSYALQGSAFAAAFATASITTVSVLVSDDAAGTALEADLGSTLEAGDTELLASAKVSEPDAVATVTAGSPGAIVVATDGATPAENAATLSALVDAGAKPGELWLASDTVFDYSDELPGGTLEGAHGLLPGAVPTKEFRARLRLADPYLSEYRFAAEAYDATVLVALSAMAAGDDGGHAIARELSAVSAGGIRCSSFAECVHVLDAGEEIDYAGISGAVDLDANGDVSGGTYSQILYGDDGNFADDRIIRVD